MSESVEPGQDADAPASVELRSTSDGVTVRKVARLHDSGAAAVYLTLRSDRPDRCRVHLRDPLPEAVRHNTVEFHPHYDPANWYRADDATVYEAPLVPGGERMTAYGVLIDEPDQLGLFEASPELDVEPLGAGEDLAGDAVGTSDGRDTGFAFENGSGGDPASTTSAPDGGSTTETHGSDDGSPIETDAASAGQHGRATRADTSTATPPDDDSANSDTGPGRASSRTGTTRQPATVSDSGMEIGHDASGGDVADELVAALDRREQTAEWRQDLRVALGLDSDRASDERVTALSDELETLRGRVSALESLEERLVALEETVEALEETVEREAEWRDRLRRQLGAEPDDP